MNGEFVVAAYIINAVIILGYCLMIWLGLKKYETE